MTSVLLLSLPLVLFFSYQPNFHLASTASMNLEFSLPLIWLVIFTISNLRPFYQKLTQLQTPLKLLTLLNVIYLIASALLSMHPLRGFLTLGIMALLVFFALFIILVAPKLQPAKFWRIFFASTLAICAFCFLQMILDISGISRQLTLLCSGCLSTGLGFPRATGFAIEPQFMGNLLLAPALLTLYALIKPRLLPFTQKQLLVIFVVIFTTLMLTLSRGAIYAFALAAIVMLSFSLFKRHLKLINFTLIAGTTLVCIVLSFCLQGLFTQLGPTNENFWQGTTKSIHQISLGKIDLRPQISQPIPSPQSPSANFSGYIVESTNIRVNLSKLAFQTWSSSPKNQFFGVGLGGAGKALYQASPDLGSSKEITQNQYLEWLLELGLVGTVLVVSWFAILIVFYRSKFPHHKLFFSTLAIAYGFSMLFFSGLPNALHIYLLPPLLALVLGSSTTLPAKQE